MVGWHHIHINSFACGTMFGPLAHTIRMTILGVLWGKQSFSISSSFFVQERDAETDLKIQVQTKLSTLGIIIIKLLYKLPYEDPHVSDAQERGFLLLGWLRVCLMENAPACLTASINTPAVSL